MSQYVLDTDILQLFQEGHPAVVSRVSGVVAGDLAISVVTVEEQLSGWYTLLRKARRPEKLAWAYRRLAANVRFLSGLRILDFDEAAIERYEALRALKLKVRKMDLRIATTALEHGAILVSRNVRDFEQVPGLAVEDWSK
jgi:tRNA(fMet)-specific endonuclease VapC